MARINKGILGPVEGSVGTVTGASWKGINYIRSKSAGSKKTSTADQLDHQLKFSVVINFVSTMTALLQQTFKKYAVKMSEANAAFSYNYNNALTGKSPDYEIDYSKALVSRGELPNATAPAATVTAGVINFTWTDNTGESTAAATDKAVLVAYCKNFNQTIFTIDAAERSANAATLNVTNFKGFNAEVWIAFVNTDGDDASNSIYLGELLVS